MCQSIIRETSGCEYLSGRRRSSSAEGRSVASDNDARESISRFTHSIWTAFNGVSCTTQQSVNLVQANTQRHGYFICLSLSHRTLCLSVCLYLHEQGDQSSGNIRNMIPLTVSQEHTGRFNSHFYISYYSRPKI